MPTLKNERYETFARELVKAIALDRSEADSYIAAGFKAKNPNSAAAAASRLLARHPEIHARCAELQARAARRTNVTIESLVLEAEKARALAMEIRQPASAVSASSLKAKLTGNLINRAEVGEPGEFTRAETFADLVDNFLEQINPVPTAQIPQNTRDAVLDLFRAFLEDLDKLLSGDARRHRFVTAPPFCDTARALLAEGANPKTPLIMRHHGSTVDALRATIAVAGAMTVENRNGYTRLTRSPESPNAASKPVRPLPSTIAA